MEIIALLILFCVIVPILYFRQVKENGDKDRREIESAAKKARSES